MGLDKPESFMMGQKFAKRVLALKEEHLNPWPALPAIDRTITHKDLSVITYMAGACFKRIGRYYYKKDKEGLHLAFLKTAEVQERAAVAEIASYDWTLTSETENGRLWVVEQWVLPIFKECELLLRSALNERRLRKLDGGKIVQTILQKEITSNIVNIMLSEMDEDKEFSLDEGRVVVGKLFHCFVQARGHKGIADKVEKSGKIQKEKNSIRKALKRDKEEKQGKKNE